MWKVAHGMRLKSSGTIDCLPRILILAPLWQQQQCYHYSVNPDCAEFNPTHSTQFICMYSKIFPNFFSQLVCHSAAAVPLRVCWRVQTEPWWAAALQCVLHGTPASSKPWSVSLVRSGACMPAAPGRPEHPGGPHLCLLPSTIDRIGKRTWEHL